jgi:hypothetical protein
MQPRVGARQPQGQTVKAGSNVTFTIIATGTLPLYTAYLL